MNSFLKGLICTAVGGGIAWISAQAAYKIGKESGRVEAECDRLHTLSTFGMSKEHAEKQLDIPLEKDKKPSKLRTLFKARKLYKDHAETIKGLINDPEAHILEACVSDGELHLRVKNAEEKK